jgi:hypothetical protein
MINVLRYRRNEEALNELCQLVGEHVKDANPSKQVVAASDRQAYFNAIENLTRQHVEQYNWELPTDFPADHPAMAILLGWQNNRIQRILNNKSKSLPFPYCAYHDSLPNSWTHPLDRPDETTKRIVLDCTPPRVSDLLRELRASSRL